MLINNDVVIKRLKRVRLKKFMIKESQQSTALHENEKTKRLTETSERRRDKIAQ